MKIYKAKKISLETIGILMGGKQTPTIWEKFFTNKKEAKKFCEEDHGEKIKWTNKKDFSSAGDLKSHSYDIMPIKVND